MSCTAVFSLCLLIATGVYSVIVLRNFGKGLKTACRFLRISCHRSFDLPSVSSETQRRSRIQLTKPPPGCKYNSQPYEYNMKTPLLRNPLAFTTVIHPHTPILTTDDKWTSAYLLPLRILLAPTTHSSIRPPTCISFVPSTTLVYFGR